MAVTVIPNGDGTFRYRDNMGNTLTAEEAKAAPKEPGVFDRVMGAMSSAESAVVDLLKPAGETELDKQMELAKSIAAGYNSLSTTNPDTNARMQEAAQVLGTDSTALMTVDPALQAQAENAARGVNNAPKNWYDMVSNFPATAQYLSNPANLAKSHDDINILTAIEDTGAAMANSYSLSVLQQQRAQFGIDMQSKNQAIGDLDPERKQELDDLNAKIKALHEKVPESVWSVSGVLGGVAGMAPQLISGLKNIPLGAAGGAATGALATGGVGAVPGALAGAAIGFQTGFAKEFANNSAGNTYLDELTKGVDKRSAAKGSLVSGGLTFALSLPMVAKWMKIPNVAEESGMLKSLGISTIEQSFLGASLAASQLAGTKTAEGRLSEWTGEDIGVIAKGGVDMIPIALSMSAPGYGWAAVHQLGKQVDQSKTMQRDPKAVADQINTTASGTPLETIKLSSDSLYQYMQSVSQRSPQEAKTIADRLGVNPEELQNIIATGGDVEVKLGNYETLPTEHRNALLADVKVANLPSAREMQRLYEDSKAGVEEGDMPAGKSFAEDVGIMDIQAHADATKLVEAEKAKAVASDMDYTKAEATHISNVERSIKSELDAMPLYKAEDNFNFNLQLFGGMKDVKEIAKNYRSNKLTAEQELYFDQVAEQHGYASGDKLAKDITNNRLRDEEAKTRLKFAADQFKKQNGEDIESKGIQSEISEAALKKTAIENEILDKVSSGAAKQAVREKQVSDMVSRYKDAENRLLMDIEKAKSKDKQDQLKQELADLKKQHKEEMSQAAKGEAYTARWYQAEIKRAEKDRAAQDKADYKVAREWLKAEAASQRFARNTDLSISDVKAYASHMSDVLPIGKAADYKGHFLLSRKAAVESERAYRKGMYDEAAKWKSRELVNHAMALQGVKMFREFNKQKRFLDSVKSAKRDSFKRQDHFDQAASILYRFGIARKDFAPGQQLETLAQWSDRMTDSMGTVSISDWLYDERVKMDYSELTATQLKDVSDALRNIKTVANLEKKSIAAIKGADIEEVTKGMIDKMNLKKDVHDIAENRDTFRNKLSMVTADLKTFSTVIGKLEGWESGNMSKFFLDSVNEAADRESVYIANAKKQYESVWSPYSAKEKRQISTKKIAVDELGVSVTKDKLIGLALNLGNADNKAKLLGTRPIDFEKATNWDEGSVMLALQNNLTAKDWKMVQGTWDMVNSLWPDIAENHKTFTGFAPEKVEAVPFDVTLSDGSTLRMEGGYYPLAKDYRANLMDSQRMDDNAALYDMRNSAMIATTRKGFTKQRNSVNYAVSLDPNVMTKHIMDVVHDLCFRGIVSDFNRVMRDPAFQTTVFSKVGEAGTAAFKDYVKNIVGSPYRDVGMDGVGSIMRWMKKSTANAAISMRLGVMTQNAANIILYPGATKGFGVKDTMEGLVRYGLFDYFPKLAVNWRAASKFSDDIYALSPFMRDRQDRPDYSLRELQSDMFSNKKGLAEFSSSLMTFTDNLTAKPMWKQAYMKKMSETGNQKESVRYADGLIRNVIGSGRRYDQAPFMRADASTIKGFMNTFQGFMTTELNRWMKEAGIASQDPIVRSPRFLAFVGSRLVIFTLLSNLFGGKLPDEKDDPFKWFAANALSYPGQLVPFVRDVAPIAISTAFGVKTYGYRPPVAFSGLESLSKAIVSTGGYAKGTPQTTGQSVVEKWTKTAAYLTGTPDQLNAWFWNAYDYYKNGMAPIPMDIMKRRPREERR